MRRWCPAASTNSLLLKWNIDPQQAKCPGAFPSARAPWQPGLLQHAGQLLAGRAQHPPAVVCLVPRSEQGCSVPAGPVRARDGGAGLCMVKKGSVRNEFGRPAPFQPQERQRCCLLD